MWFINKSGRNFLSKGIKYHLMSDLVNNNCHKLTEEHNQNPSGMWLSRYIIIKLIRPSFYHQTQLLWPLVLLFGREGRTLEIFGHPIGKLEYVSWIEIQNTLLMWCSLKQMRMYAHRSFRRDCNVHGISCQFIIRACKCQHQDELLSWIYRINWNKIKSMLL